MATRQIRFDDVGLDLLARDTERALRCHELLRDLPGSSTSGAPLT